jgi:hypothetical protein
MDVHLNSLTRRPIPDVPVTQVICKMEKPLCGSLNALICYQAIP